MPAVVYRSPGNLSEKSLRYLSALEKNGWPTYIVQELAFDLLRFESVSLQDDTESAMLACVSDDIDKHRSFLEKLNQFIKAISKAERYEELHNKATHPGKDSIAANVLLGRASNKNLSLDALKSSRVKLEKLEGMTDDDIKRELAATSERLKEYG